MTRTKDPAISRGHLYVQKHNDGTWDAWTMWERKAVSALEHVTLRQVETYARRERYALILV